MAAMAGCQIGPTDSARNAIVRINEPIVGSTVKIINIVGAVAGMPPDFQLRESVRVLDEEHAQAKLEHLEIVGQRWDEPLALRSTYDWWKVSGIYVIDIVNNSEFTYNLSGFGLLVARGYLRGESVLVRPESSVKSESISIGPGKQGTLEFNLEGVSVRQVFDAASAAGVVISSDDFDFLGPNWGNEWRPNWGTTLGLSVSRRSRS